MALLRRKKICQSQIIQNIYFSQKCFFLSGRSGPFFFSSNAVSSQFLIVQLKRIFHSKSQCYNYFFSRVPGCFRFGYIQKAPQPLCQCDSYTEVTAHHCQVYPSIHPICPTGIQVQDNGQKTPPQYDWYFFLKYSFSTFNSLSP